MHAILRPYAGYSTDDARDRFTIKKEAVVNPLLVLEPFDGQLKALEDAILTFRFAKGTTMSKAEAIAKESNASIEIVRLIQYPPNP